MPQQFDLSSLPDQPQSGQAPAYDLSSLPDQPKQGLLQRLGGWGGIAGTGVRMLGGVLGAEGYAPGAAINAGAEALAERLQGQSYDPKAIATEAAFGAIPFGSVVKPGEMALSALRSGLLGAAHQGVSQAVQGQNPLSESTGLAGLLGGVTGGLGSKFVPAAAEAGNQNVDALLPKELQAPPTAPPKTNTVTVPPQQWEVIPTSQTGGGASVLGGGKISAAKGVPGEGNVKLTGAERTSVTKFQPIQGKGFTANSLADLPDQPVFTAGSEQTIPSDLAAQGYPNTLTSDEISAIRADQEAKKAQEMVQGAIPADADFVPGKVGETYSTPVPGGKASVRYTWQEREEEPEPVARATGISRADQLAGIKTSGEHLAGGTNSPTGVEAPAADDVRAAQMSPEGGDASGVNPQKADIAAQVPDEANVTPASPAQGANSVVQNVVNQIRNRGRVMWGPGATTKSGELAQASYSPDEVGNLKFDPQTPTSYLRLQYQLETDPAKKAFLASALRQRANITGAQFSPLQQAATLPETEAKVAGTAAEPPAAAQASAQETPVGRPAPDYPAVTGISEDERMNRLAALQKLMGSEHGAMMLSGLSDEGRRKLLSTLGGAAIGGTLGAGIDEDDPMTGGIYGALGGGMLGHAYGGASAEAAEAGMNAAQQRAAGGQELVNYRNAGLLSGPAQLKKPLSDLGTYLSTVAEKLGSGDRDTAIRMVQNLIAVPTNVRNYIAAMKDPSLSREASGELGRALDVQGGPSPLGWVTRPFGAAQYATQMAMERSGIDRQEALDRLFLGQSNIAPFQKIQELARTPFGRVVMPFQKIYSNIAEQGLQRIPGVNQFVGPAEGRGVRAAIGAGTIGLGALQGEREQEAADEGDPGSAAIRGLERAGFGPYALPYMLGETMTGPGALRDLYYAIPGLHSALEAPGAKQTPYSWLKGYTKDELEQMLPSAMIPWQEK